MMDCTTQAVGTHAAVTKFPSTPSASPLHLEVRQLGASHPDLLPCLGIWSILIKSLVVLIGMIVIIVVTGITAIIVTVTIVRASLAWRRIQDHVHVAKGQFAQGLQATG